MAAAVLAAPADALAASPGCTAAKAGSLNGVYMEKGPYQFSVGETLTLSVPAGGDSFEIYGLFIGAGSSETNASLDFETGAPAVSYYDSNTYNMPVVAGQDWLKWGTYAPNANWTVSCVAPTPTLSAISPSVVPAAGGTGVTITGTNFLGATEVLFGGAAASVFVVNSATQISAQEPANAAGAVDVKVVTPEGEATLAGALTYANPPDAPTGVSATAGNGQASVAFTAPADNGGDAIGSYTVTSIPGGRTATGGASPLTVTGLTPGTSYTFTVTAANGVGPGAASAASSAVTIKSGQTITFPNPGAQNFGTMPTLVATSTSGLTVSFTSSTPGVCTIPSGDTLIFLGAGSCTINADQAGDGSYVAATTVTRTFTVLPVVPGAPTAVTATAGDGQASVAFTAPANVGGTAITGYTVTAAPGGASNTGASSPITVTGLTNDTAYTFTVTATNAAGTGAASAASSAVSPLAAPAAGAISLTVAANSTANPITLNLSGGAATSVAVASAASHGTATASGTSISYTPTAGYSGPDSFTYTATNAGGTSAPATVSITVTPPLLVLTPASLPAATAGTAYSTTLSASGGTAPYAYAIAAGTLPTGLSLNTTTGALSGTPTTWGAANFTVTATDSLFASGARAYSLSISKATPSVLLSASSTSLVVGESVTFTASVMGGASPTGPVTFTEGGTTLGSATLSGGSASFSTILAAGTHIITATYAGDGLNTAASSSSVTVTIALPTLTLTPGSGGVTPAKVGLAYDLPITVDGAGAASSFTTSGLPPGLSLVETDAAHVAISGTPTATGAYTITVNASSGAATGSATYNLTVTAATPALSLTASPTSAAAGETVTLTATLTGGASPTGTIQFATNGANIGSAVALVGGTASVSTSSLSSGTHPITAVYSGDGNNSGATSAAVTVSIGTVARPDPGQDAAAKAIVTSQAATASRIGQRQIANTFQRLEQLHDEGERPMASGHAASQDGESDGRLRLPGRRADATYALAYGDDTPVSPRKTSPGEAASQVLGQLSQAFEAAERKAELPFHLWSAGTIDWGRAGEGGDDRFTTSGFTVGLDRRMGDSLTMGVAGGIAIDRSTFGPDTASDGTAYTAQLYASLKLAPETWLDLVGGYGALQFDSERWSGGGLHEGDRDGSNLFGSLGLSSARDISGLKLTGYGRLDIVRVALDGYAETGPATSALAYDEMDTTTLTGVAGLRASYALPMDWGTLTPGGRIEYRHAFDGGFTQRLGYADLGGFDAAIAGDSSTRDSASFGLSLTATTLDGLDLDVEYRLSTDGDGIGSQQVRAGFRLPF